MRKPDFQIGTNKRRTPITVLMRENNETNTILEVRDTFLRVFPSESFTQRIKVQVTFVSVYTLIVRNNGEH